MKKQLTKTLALFLTFALLISAVPIYVSAAESTHTHNNVSKSWSVWDGTSTLLDGYYYLEEDIVLSRTQIINYYRDVNLCLNGHTITYEDTAFSIYSGSHLSIYDCIGTGTIETSSKTDEIGATTIINNGYLKIYGGTILNSGSRGNAVYTCENANTVVYGGKISGGSSGIYKDIGSYVQVYDGEIHGGDLAVSGHGNENSTKTGSLIISGGTFSSDTDSCMNLGKGNLTIKDGIINGSIQIYDINGTTEISGGTINSLNGHTHFGSKSTTISGGEINAYSWGAYNAKISGGKFSGGTAPLSHCSFYGTSTITGGDFTEYQYLYIDDTASITGGSFKHIYINGYLNLSCSPEIESITINKANSLSASSNSTMNNIYNGSPIKINLSSELKNGDVLVENVASYAADRFVFDKNESKWKYTELVNNNIVLTILPNGKCGYESYWGIEDGTLTIYGLGALWDEAGGTSYPWYNYSYNITKIIVEDGITYIPAYAFSYCENLKTISLPDTLTEINISAFNNCEKLDNILLPSSLKKVTSKGTNLNFIGCKSLKNVYYLGTSEEWLAMSGGIKLSNLSTTMTVNYLKYYPSTRTCTSAGYDAYYKFDNTSVYSNYYDENKNPVDLYYKSSLGHDMGEWIEDSDSCIVRKYCSRCDYSSSKITYNHKFTEKVTIPATHIKEGVKTYSCGCGYYRTESIQMLPEHNFYITDVIESTCSTSGYTEYTCECGASYTEDVGFDPDIHINDDDDPYHCDDCNELICGCMCHKSGFIGFIWKILRIMYKIFGTNPVCSCGMAHY